MSNPVDNAIKDRFSCRSYINKPIESGLLEKILGLTMAYRMLVARDASSKKAVYDSLMKMNQTSTEKCSAYVVFVAENNPVASCETFTRMMKKTSAPEASIQGSISYVKGLFPPDICLSTPPTNYDLASHASAAESVGSAMMTFMTLCTAHGLATLPMGGLDAAAMGKALNVPKGYAVQAVISVGYATPDAKKFESVRYEPADIVFEGSFGNPMKGVPNTNPIASK